MVSYRADYTYMKAKDADLFTVSLLPNAEGKFPTVVVRTPYVDDCETKSETDIAIECMNQNKAWLESGYAMVIQHCRGRGRSSGDCIAYINEREDGLALQEWIRKQSFYDGELYLKGGSYLTSVHYATAPFADDIKGAVFGIQDCERYNICYRNGFLKKALHCEWYVGMYKAKSHMKKNYVDASFDILPLKNFTKTVFGESAEDFDEMLKAPNRENDFWNTRFGGSDARNATGHAKFPILLTTGFYDIYTGGIFDMWNKMDGNTRNISAMVVSPYDHGDDCVRENSIIFENGKRTEQFGENYEIEWFDYIRGKKDKTPFEQGRVTYYRLFENKWATDTFKGKTDKMTLVLGESEVSYVYNPYAAPRFKGGLSRAFGGAEFQDKPNSRYDIVSVYSEPFEKDMFVKGKMSAKLRVKSDCEDTCFYVRVSITKEKGDFALRDDITSLCGQLGDYTPNTEAELEFEFDEHAFLIKKGERIRVDIASADNEHYVRHTNLKGLYSEQTEARVANNTVYLQNSCLSLPIEIK